MLAMGRVSCYTILYGIGFWAGSDFGQILSLGRFRFQILGTFRFWADSDREADLEQMRNGTGLTIQALDYELTVCKAASVRDADLTADILFLARTDEEISLVCETARVPNRTLAREDGWKCFRVQGTLDFSLTGILSGLTAVLAEQGIGIFAASTYNTDYVLVKRENFVRALRALSGAGYEVVPGEAVTGNVVPGKQEDVPGKAVPWKQESVPEKAGTA